MRRQIQLLAGAMMASLVVIAVVVALALPGDDRFAAPPLWLLAAQFGAGAALFAVIEAMGYRAAAIDPETDEQSATTQALAAFQAGTIVRFALSEVVALGSLATAFVIDEGGATGYATGAVVSLALMAYHAWPWSRPVDRTVVQLERDGGRSELREGLGLPPTLRGAITEL